LTDGLGEEEMDSSEFLRVFMWYIME